MKMLRLVLVSSLLLTGTGAALVPKASAQTAPAASEQYNALVAKARELSSKKQYAEAIVHAENAIRLNDRRWEAFVAAARSYAAQGLLDDAIGMLQLGIARAPQGRKERLRDAIVEARKQVLAATRGADTTPIDVPEKSIYSAADPDVVPPVPVRMEVPPSPNVPDLSSLAGKAAVRVVVDEKGNVRQFATLLAVEPTFDLELAKAITRWKFNPATKAGVPVWYILVGSVKIPKQ